MFGGILLMIDSSKKDNNGDSSVVLTVRLQDDSGSLGFLML